MTMPYFGDCLLPLAERHASLKFRRFKNIRDIYRYTRDELVEIRAMQLTPGMNRECLDILLLWPRDVQDKYLRPLVELDAEAMPLAQLNHVNATVEDGHAMLRAILDHRPTFSRYVPFYVTTYLQHRRRRGADAPTLAREFNTARNRIERWWRQETHDPLSGERRDPNTVRRGKPIKKGRPRVLGI